MHEAEIIMRTDTYVAVEVAKVMILAMTEAMGNGRLAETSNGHAVAAETVRSRRGGPSLGN